ncbi:MAG TPA: LuxR C-terminal-related transcriptional regulator [Nocardioidaceae bacterium]
MGHGIRTGPTSWAEQSDPGDRSGRDRELRRACDLLAEGATRLVTFTGPAGVGKTWTARELKRRLVTTRGCRAATIHADCAHGFTELLQTTAEALGMPAAGGGLSARLAQVLSGEPHVLVLDRCEHLLGHPHPVEQLLGLFPSLRVVVTSLRPLQVPGEHVIGLDPFEVPPPAGDPAELARSPAVRLFLQCAVEVHPGFDPEQADLAAIGELCRRVHGLPLGIEIMATRVGALSPAAMVEHLDTGHEFTQQHTAHGDDPHHASIRSALSWSYRMLDDDSARLLRRMAVFEAPATLDMLAAVVPEGAGTDVAETASGLVDHRLIDPYPVPGEPAFALVGLLRDFAAERLVEEGEQAWVEEAHTQAVLDFAVERSATVELAEDDVAQGELARAEADLRAVLRRLLGRADVEGGLLLASALAPFVLRRGYDGFVRPALDSLLRRARDRGDPVVTRAELWQARLAAHFDGPAAADEVRATLAHALDRARRNGDDATVLLGLAFVMQTMPVTQDLAGASAAAAEGLPRAVATGDPRWMARFDAWAGMVANQAGRVDESLELARRGVELVEECPDPRGQILLSLLLAGLPRPEAAPLMARLPGVDDLLTTARRLDDARYEPFLLRTAAGLAVAEGDVRTAAARCAECLRLAHRHAAWHDLPFATMLLALVAMSRGDLDRAAQLHGMCRAHLDVLRPGTPPGWLDDYLAKVDEARLRLGGAEFEAQARRGETDMQAGVLADALAYADAVSGRGGATGGVTRLPSADAGEVEPQRLTPRELEVLEELVTGATNKEISHRLGMTPKTAMHHATAIYRKLGVRGRAEATAWAFRHGFAD